jgi:hypothetical protein
MDLHERADKCREVFSMLSEYLNLELPPDAWLALPAQPDLCDDDAIVERSVYARCVNRIDWLSANARVLSGSLCI